MSSQTHGLLHGAEKLGLESALRRAAIEAPVGSRRTLWLAAVAAGATLAFALILAALPSGIGLSSRGLDDIHQAMEQGRRLAAGSLSGDGLFPLAYPLWLLLLSSHTNDISLAARVLSGLSAVFVLFLVHQLCHVLSDPERADEQSCFALLALVLSPAFFLAAADGGSLMPHLALLLAALLCLQRAVASGRLLLTVLAGLAVGLSVLLRPVSLLVPPAVGVWLLWSRPFISDEEEARPNTRHAVGFLLAFALGATPLLLLNLGEHGSVLPWGAPEAGMLAARLLNNPLGLLLAGAQSLAQYVAAEDFERLSAIGGSWQLGAWDSVVGAMIALAPTILKVVGLAGLVVLCWLERFEVTESRARLLAVLLLLMTIGGSLALVDERGPLLIGTLLLVCAFASLPSLMPGSVSGVVSLALVGLMLMHQFGVGQQVRHAASYRASDLVAAELRAAGAMPNEVMSANWSFYDTRSPWRERYRHIPIYVDTTPALIQEMSRQGARYLVFDRDAGAQHWPRLAGLLETNTHRPGLRPLSPALLTDELPPNAVAIYRLE